jgi:hypothetical protein
MRVLAMVLVAGLASPVVAHASSCPAPQPLQQTAFVPVANELATVFGGELGSPNGVLSQASDESQSVEQVLLRLSVEACRNIASIAPAGSVVDPADPGAYKPRTEFDNTPWRFNMSQNGKNMTADEFSAWMKSRGVRVARGAGAPAPAPVAAAAATPATVPGTLPPALPVAPAPAPAAPSSIPVQLPVFTPGSLAPATPAATPPKVD